MHFQSANPFEKFHDMAQALVEAFKKKYESLAGSVHVVKDAAGAFDAVAAILKETQATRVALADLPQALQDLIETHCAAQKIGVLKQPYHAADLPGSVDGAQVGVSGASFGIAPMGAFIELTTDDAVRLVSLLPNTHIAVLEAGQLLATLEEAAPRIREYFRQNPTNAAITFISGPSRSGDIEMRLTLGVHGPQVSHVIVLDPSAEAVPAHEAAQA